MSSAPTALTTKSSIRCTRTPISHYGSITNCAIGNTPTTACALTSRAPTSLLWNSSPVGNFIGERQSVTNLLDEYSPLDLQKAINRMPAAFLTDLQKGDAVMIVATEDGPGGVPVAIILLGG